MKRKIDKPLLEWMSRQGRKPLVLRGARQVGKTFSISEFGRREFESFIHISRISQNTDRALTATVLNMSLSKFPRPSGTI